MLKVDSVGAFVFGKFQNFKIKMFPYTFLFWNGKLYRSIYFLLRTAANCNHFLIFVYLKIFDHINR